MAQRVTLTCGETSALSLGWQQTLAVRHGLRQAGGASAGAADRKARARVREAVT